MGHRNTLRRLEKLKETFEAQELQIKNMVKKRGMVDKPLLRKAKALRKEVEGLRSAAIGRELVLRSITQDRDALMAKYEPERFKEYEASLSTWDGRDSQTEIY